ncbi:MAG: DUF1501 domain-containing protein [Pirellulales bacterium]
MTNFTRRRFLAENAMGVGTVALAWLLRQDAALAVPPVVAKNQVHHDLLPRSPQFAPRAEAMISLFQHGGPSHMDLTDPKPELSKFDGTDYTGDIQYSFVNSASKKLLGSPWKFQKHGECGTELSELLPHTAEIVDDICLIRSMQTGANGHEVSIRYFHNGIPAALGRPTLGAWLVYALGCESRDLPAYMVLTDPGGHPVDSTHNWTNGFMPSMFQGTVLRPTEPRILNLDAPSHLRGTLQEQNLRLLGRLNERYLDEHPGEADLEARIASYELAARMQTAARDVLDLSQETEATHKMYGLDDDATRDYGTRCLIARRLVERGVRFVQLFLGGQPWDNHSSIKSSLPGICKTDRQAGRAWSKTSSSRGMLETTLVQWGGEIGRLPVTQDQGRAPTRRAATITARGFRVCGWPAAAFAAVTYGATDEVGHAPWKT